MEAATNQLAGSQFGQPAGCHGWKIRGHGRLRYQQVCSRCPRSDFLNWALIDTGSFDYASDAWGFTYGAAAEWYQGRWTLRAGLFDLSIVPNSTELDPRFEQLQWIGEIERRYELGGQPGKLAATGFLTRGRMGRFEDAIRLAQLTGQTADIAAVRQYRSRAGISFNLEQQLSSDLGLLSAEGWPVAMSSPTSSRTSTRPSRQGSC